MNTQAITDAVVSHAHKTGHFEWVTSHEPKSAPQGVGCAVWVNYLGPLAVVSGLDATSALLVLNVRLYSSMLAEPQDLIDPQIVAACDDLMTAYTGDFTLGGLVRNVDLLGQSGERLEARAGYLEQDKKIYRVLTVSLPLIVNDAWAQVS